MHVLLSGNTMLGCRTKVCFLLRIALLTMSMTLLIHPLYGQQSFSGQNLPDTDIFLAEMSTTGSNGHSTITIGKITNITNRAGYDNQPVFTPDGNFVLYTSIRADNQADIYRYSMREQLSARVTTTPESEYSPSVTPDGKFLSVVRVERDSTQRLWKFDLRGTSPSVVLEHIKPVGYYTWIDNTRLLLFVLGKGKEAASLMIADTRNGSAQRVATGIGRSLHKVPSMSSHGTVKVSFLSKTSSGATGADTTQQRSTSQAWTIQTLALPDAVDIVAANTSAPSKQASQMLPAEHRQSASSASSFAPSIVAEALPSSEDYAWTPLGGLLMAEGTTLYYRSPSQNAVEPLLKQNGKASEKDVRQAALKEGWKKVADLSLLAGAKGITRITRLAVSPDGRRLAFVADMKP
jgi:Tol biopolymer transport system component